MASADFCHWTGERLARGDSISFVCVCARHVAHACDRKIHCLIRKTFYSHTFFDGLGNTRARILCVVFLKNVHPSPRSSQMDLIWLILLKGNPQSKSFMENSLARLNCNS